MIDFPARTRTPSSGRKLRLSSSGTGGDFLVFDDLNEDCQFDDTGRVCRLELDLIPGHQHGGYKIGGIPTIFNKDTPVR